LTTEGLENRKLDSGEFTHSFYKTQSTAKTKF
jgi:hypothetical protein